MLKKKLIIFSSLTAVGITIGIFYYYFNRNVIYSFLDATFYIGMLYFFIGGIFIIQETGFFNGSVYFFKKVFKRKEAENLPSLIQYLQQKPEQFILTKPLFAAGIFLVVFTYIIALIS